MIKINLLKSYAASTAVMDDGGIYLAEDEKKQIIIDFSKRLALILIGPIALFLWESNKLPELQAQLAERNGRLAELKQFNEKRKNLSEEIKHYEEDQARINAQMSFMRKISNDKINELKLFQYLQKFTPESVWINKLEIRGTEINISAESDVQTDISKFVDSLTAAPFLAAVSQLNQENKVDSVAKGITTTIFNVKANFNNGTATP